MESWEYLWKRRVAWEHRGTALYVARTSRGNVTNIPREHDGSAMRVPESEGGLISQDVKIIQITQIPLRQILQILQINPILQTILRSHPVRCTDHIDPTQVDT